MSLINADSPHIFCVFFPDLCLYSQLCNFIESKGISYDDSNSVGVYCKYGTIQRFIGTRFEDNYFNVKIDATCAGRNIFVGCSLGTPGSTNVIDNGTTPSTFVDCYNYKTRNGDIYFKMCSTNNNPSDLSNWTTPINLTSGNAFLILPGALRSKR